MNAVEGLVSKAARFEEAVTCSMLHKMMHKCSLEYSVLGIVTSLREARLLYKPRLWLSWTRIPESSVPLGLCPHTLWPGCSGKVLQSRAASYRRDGAATGSLSLALPVFLGETSPNTWISGPAASLALIPTLPVGQELCGEV